MNIASIYDMLLRHRDASLLSTIVTYVIVAIGLYKMFQKAGVPEWLAFIPFVNLWKLTKITCGSALWLLLILIPCVGLLVFAIFLSVKIAPAYGKGVGTVLLTIFLAPVAYLYLGFGDARYQGPQ